MSAKLEYTENVREIREVRLGILSPKRILEISVCEVYNFMTNDEHPEGTLFDPRMGTIDRGKDCPTCHNSIKLCDGHFGRIYLAKPVMLPQYRNIILKILKNLKL